MKLHTSPASPFGRKVKILALETGLLDRLELVTQALTPVSPNAEVSAANPLGKIPCLELPDGMALFDSRVICEYLDNLHGGAKMFPAAGPQRWQALRLQALGDGILDASVGTRYETFLRPEAVRWADWVAGQKQKTARSLDRLDAEAGSFGERCDIGTISVACACGYQDFRFADDKWRDGRPALATWYEQFSRRPSMQATVPA